MIVDKLCFGNENMKQCTGNEKEGSLKDKNVKDSTKNENNFKDITIKDSIRRYEESNNFSLNAASNSYNLYSVSNEKYEWMEPITGIATFQLRRLQEIDSITETMTKEEHLEFAECRQSSFVYRKGKKFREFIGNWKINENVIDVMGYIRYEMIYNIVINVFSMREEIMGHKIKFGQRPAVTVDEIDEVCWRMIRENKLFF